eukprot:COSAG02_NODE_66829_length_254_cov_0.993548_1_plen_75_part_10
MDMAPPQTGRQQSYIVCLLVRPWPRRCCAAAAAACYREEAVAQRHPFRLLLRRRHSVFFIHGIQIIEGKVLSSRT